VDSRATRNATRQSRRLLLAGIRMDLTWF